MSKSSGWIWCWVLIIVACAVTGDWTDCGSACICKWISGKKSANCASGHLREIPQLSSEIQNLDLHNNEIKILPKAAFVFKGLLNLQKINLKAAKIKELVKDSFKDLRILVEVDLSDNYLTSLPLNIFDGNERLRFVTFNNNPLTTLFAYQFSILPYLKNLGFCNCRLKHIHPLAFYGLDALETLDLRKNLLQTVSAVSFSIPSMKSVFLTGNPWRCDCLLRDFKNWFLESNLGNEELRCDSPQMLAGESWLDIADDQMGCVPQLKASAKILRPELGSQITLGCTIKSDPKTKVHWLFNEMNASHHIFQNNIILENLEFRTDSSLFDEFDSAMYTYLSSNITILNVTESDSGDWTCKAENVIGEASVKISLIIPRVHVATTRTEPTFPAQLEITGVLCGTLGIFVLIGVLQFWRSHMRSNVPLSGSLTDHAKTLPNTSKATNNRLGTHFNLPPNIEIVQLSPSTFEEGKRIISFEPIHITLENSPVPAFLPPPPEIAMPRSNYRNIYISVQVADFDITRAEKYPDLLGGATLPRYTRASCEVKYDNMGPRVSATGSSTLSLPGSDIQNTFSKTSEPTPVLKSL